MATIINALYIQNFFNFYGDYDQNYYEFNPGLNVIIADNGNGKSKLFSAFSWILKDEVIDSDKETNKIVKVKTIMAKMISDKAKNETLLNSDVKCGVRITYSDDQYEYEVEKSLWGRRMKEGSPTDQDNWHCDINEVRVSKKDKMLLDFRPVNDVSEKQSIINKLIRPQFLQYALLQGEEVDNILNFNDKNSLKAAVDVLTNIKNVERLIDLARYLADKGDSELTDAKKQLTRNVNEFNSKVRERTDLKSKIERRQVELEKYTEDLVKAKAERDNLISLLLNAQQREELRSERGSMKRELERTNTEHADFLNNLNDNFFDNQKAWLFYNTQHFESAFNKMRDEYIEARQAKKIKNELSQDNVFSTSLPAESPDSYSLKRMLKDEICMVCGRPALKDSPEWEHIHLVLDHHTPKPELPAKHSFTQMLDTLMKSASAYSNQVAIINEGFTSARVTDKHFRTLKQELYQAMEDKQNELIGLGETKEEVDQATINRYGAAEKRITKYETEIKSADDDLVLYASQLERKNKEIDGLTTGNLNKAYEDRKKMMQDVLLIALNSKKRIYREVLQELEDKSNYYFKEMTRANTVDGGIIRMTANPDDTFSVDICDEEGNKIYGLSEGFQRMKKLAVITAIIATVEGGRLGYPLIADAPLSSFGKGFIQGFFEKVPEVFHQSIIMVKDLFDQSSENLLSDIGNEVLNRIKVSSGSLHLNQIKKGPQISRETKIRRY